MKTQGRWHSQPYPLIPDFPSIPCINPPPTARNEFTWTGFMFLWHFSALQIMKTQGRWYSQPYSPHTPLSIKYLHQPTSKHMKWVRLNSFCLSVAFLALQRHKSTMTLTLSATSPSYPTPNPLTVYSLRQPPSKCMKRVHSNWFHVCVTSPALCIQQCTTASTPSYPTCHLFPASTASKFTKQVCLIICMDGQGCMLEIHAYVGVVMSLKSEWVYGGCYRGCTRHSWKNLTVHYVATWCCLTIPHVVKILSDSPHCQYIYAYFFDIKFGSIDRPNMYNINDQLHTCMFLRFSFIDILPLKLQIY